MPSRTKSARYSRRRARRKALVVNDLTPAQWAALREAWDGCAYCDTGDDGALQKDCMLPISRGGRYTLENVVPACRSCNASKGNLELTVWMRRKKKDEREFWTRQVTIARALAPAEVVAADGEPVAPD
ncbi:HNH endonuclease [Nocardioides bruguierae]|uniref:HNH endonuclease n=1 Tax=Nocardioides bruguierae TaxID=2945102 RepID=A0A9X2D9Y2_9ACTN|nr:HNH endonuclease [Nocardioides bruguierae]MCM0622063.1 HNH endonuclease [Nocardioides bruguierae]